MAAKFNGKTYEKSQKKTSRLLDTENSSSGQSQKSFPLKMDSGEDYSLIASEVARLINPVIEMSINKAVDKLQLEIGKISQQLGRHEKRFFELESTVSSIYDDSNKAQKKIDNLEKRTHELLLKVDDLENRSRRNNLRFVGISESHKVDSLAKLVSKIIPLKLGISLTNDLKIERIHRIGPFKEAQLTRPRVVIAKFLDYSEKNDLFQAYKKSKGLELEGNKILIFQDYSLSLSQRRKDFSKACQMLMSLKINFSLLYPAKLKIVLPTGTRIFSDPKEATHFVQQLETRNLNNPKQTRPIHNSSGSDPFPQKDQREKKNEKSRLQTQCSSKEPRLGPGGCHRSRSRSPFSSLKISPPPSIEDDMAFDS